MTVVFLKLINQFCVIHKGSKAFFKSMLKILDSETRELTESEIKTMAINSGLADGDLEIMSENMHDMLSEKTSGEARQRLTASEPGAGIITSQRI